MWLESTIRSSFLAWIDKSDTEACETHKVQEAAAHFVVSVGVWLQQLFYHGQEVTVHRQDFLQVREQHLEGDRIHCNARGQNTNIWRGHKFKNIDKT